MISATADVASEASVRDMVERTVSPNAHLDGAALCAGIGPDRWVLRVYPRRTAKNTLEFLDAVIEETGFPIQRIQADRGSEFFAYKVQERLMKYGVKFRPIRPGSPHLNGKVERSQKSEPQCAKHTIQNSLFYLTA